MVDVLRLANKILVHAQSTLVHKVCGSFVEIINNVVHIHIRPVIRALFPNQSPALKMLGIIACKNEPVSPAVQLDILRKQVRRTNLQHYVGV